MTNFNDTKPVCRVSQYEPSLEGLENCENLSDKAGGRNLITKVTIGLRTIAYTL